MKSESFEEIVGKNYVDQADIERFKAASGLGKQIGATPVEYSTELTLIEEMDEEGEWHTVDEEKNAEDEWHLTNEDRETGRRGVDLYRQALEGKSKQE